MQPQNTPHASNTLADWVNGAPSLEDAAQRYTQIIHGTISEQSDSFYVPPYPGSQR